MKTKIAAIKQTVLPTKSGGNWTKLEVKLEGHGEEIFELSGYKPEYTKVGDVLVGYIFNKPWVGTDGQTRYNKMFKRVDAGYLYDLVLLIDPNVEQRITGGAELAAAPPVQSGDGFDTGQNVGMPQQPPITQQEVDPTDEIKPGDIPF